MRKLRFLLPLVLLIGAVVMPPTTEATWAGPLLPGRPLATDGHTGNGCRGTAYGRVAGDFVLFVANHCFASTIEGTPIYDEAVSPHKLIGYMGRQYSYWNNNDLSYIVLDSTRIPSTNRNAIYRGNTGTGDNYYHITHQPTYGCTNINNSHTGDYVYMPWQPSQSTSDLQRSGTVISAVFDYTDGKDDTCLIDTTIGETGPCCSSGSPLVPSWDTSTVLGVATITDTSGRIVFNDLYYGMEDLNSYWASSGGAYFCNTSTTC